MSHLIFFHKATTRVTVARPHTWSHLLVALSSSTFIGNPDQIPCADHVRLQPLPVVGVGVGRLAGVVRPLSKRGSLLPGRRCLRWLADLASVAWT